MISLSTSVIHGILSRIYFNSSLATLGDAVGTLLLCEIQYKDFTKKEISENKQKILSNDFFGIISNSFGFTSLRNDGKYTNNERFLSEQLKNDSSTLFEAVLGAMWLDIGEKRTREIWKNLFFPELANLIKG